MQVHAYSIFVARVPLLHVVTTFYGLVVLAKCIPFPIYIFIKSLFSQYHKMVVTLEPVCLIAFGGRTGISLRFFLIIQSRGFYLWVFACPRVLMYFSQDFEL